MTIERLIGMTADELEKLSDEELTTLLSPYFKATRPDPTKVMMIKKKETLKQKQESLNKEYEKALDLAKRLGIKV